MSGSPPRQPSDWEVRRAQSMVEKDAELLLMRATIDHLRGYNNAYYDVTQRYKEAVEERDAAIKNLRQELNGLRERLQSTLRAQKQILEKFEGRCKDLEGFRHECLEKVVADLNRLESLSPLLEERESSVDDRVTDEDDTPSE